MSTTGLVWFRRDLRLDDNPAWARATSDHDNVVALYVVDPTLFDAASSRRTARLLGDVDALDRRLREFGGRLLVRLGDPRMVVPAEAARHPGWYDDAGSLPATREVIVLFQEAATQRPPRTLKLKRPGE